MISCAIARSAIRGVALFAVLLPCACDVTSVVGINVGSVQSPEASDGAVDGGSNASGGLVCPSAAPLRACRDGGCMLREVGGAAYGNLSLAADEQNLFLVTHPDAIGWRPLEPLDSPSKDIATSVQLSHLAIDDSLLYWSEFGGAIRSVPKMGGEVVDVMSPFGHPTDIAIGPEHVYAVLPESGEIAMTTKPSGSPTKRTGQRAPSAIAVDGTYVYWVNAGLAGNDGELVRARHGDLTSAEVIEGGLARPIVITLSEDGIFWASESEIHRVPRAGGPSEVIAVGLTTVKRLAVFDGVVYAATGGGLLKVPAVGGGAVTTLDKRLMSALTIACSGVYALGWYEPVLVRYGAQ